VNRAGTRRPEAAAKAAPVGDAVRPGVVVRPFRALLYDPQRAPDLSAVLAPPYDVIDPTERRLLLKRHRYNCVRLILPQARPKEPRERKYVRAGRDLRCWLCRGVLRELEESAVFVLREEFQLEGHRHSRLSFIAAVRLEPLGSGPIYPHEETMGEARRDRLALLRATRANLSLVMSLFQDAPPAGPTTRMSGGGGTVSEILEEVSTGEPLLQAAGPGGVGLGLWAVTSPAVSSRLAAEMARRQLFIADGHHRYETALAFARDEGALGSSDPQGAGFVPMQCVPMEDPGLLALPTHRLFPTHLQVGEGRFLKQVREYFDIEQVKNPGVGLSRLREVMGRSYDPDGRSHEHVFGLYGTDRRAYLLRLRKENVLNGIECPYDHEARRLDVCVFQELIVRKVFGLDFSLVARDGTLRFTHTFVEGEQRVESGEIALAFFVNPTPLAAIPMVAGRGEVMPPKSTYFFPKVPAGLLFRLIR